MKRPSLTLAVLAVISGAHCFGKELPALEPKFSMIEPKEGWDYFFGSCSWYCGAPAMRFEATSSLTEAGGMSYPAMQAHDQKMTTVWSEGVPGNGEGEKLTFTFSTTKKDTTDLGVTSCAIATGYQASKNLFLQNSRPKRLQLIVDGHPTAVLNLKDEMGLQWFEIPKLKLERPSTHTISLKILEVYPGAKFQDTCISEVYFQGTGQMH